MHILTTRESLQAWRFQTVLPEQNLAFVPTMGNLHEGHLSLIRMAKLHAPKTLVSIFINPTQFGEGEDFASYPRTLKSDLQKLKEAQVNAVFAPTDSKQLYPEGIPAIQLQPLSPLADTLCGEHRPGHFNGVLQVVNKLFNLCRPTVALFGEKDYQQLTLIRQMVQDFFMPIDIIAAPTAREPSGLAMSSRNQYLDSEARQIAPALYRTLQSSAEAFKGGRLDEPDARQSHCKHQMEALNALGFSMQYYAIRQASNLAPLNDTKPVQDKGAIVLAAGYLGTTRLIDNCGI